MEDTAGSAESCCNNDTRSADSGSNWDDEKLIDDGINSVRGESFDGTLCRVDVTVVVIYCGENADTALGTGSTRQFGAFLFGVVGLYREEFTSSDADGPRAVNDIELGNVLGLMRAIIELCCTVSRFVSLTSSYCLLNTSIMKPTNSGMKTMLVKMRQL